MQKIVNRLFLGGLLVILGCSSVSLLQNRSVPVDFIIKQQVSLVKEPAKILYSGFEGTYFILDSGKNQVSIQKKEEINIISNQNSSNIRLGRISDIELSKDGGIIVLDRDNKSILKYDRDGSFVTKFDLKNFADPCLMTITNDETVFVFDCAENKIFAVDLLTQKILFDFGDFLLDEPRMMKAFQNFLVVYDRDGSKIFSKLGQYLDVAKGFVFFDKGNRFDVDGDILRCREFDFNYDLLSFGYSQINVFDSQTILINKKTAIIGEIIYESSE